MSEINPIPLSDDAEKQVKLWAADDRLWTTQETVEFNLRTFARVILKTNRGIAEGSQFKTNEINVLVKENNELRERFEIRERALRDIKAVHTRWYHNGENDGGYAANTMEEIAVSVWQRESIGTEPL